MAVNDTVERVLKCVICTDELREPKTLPCNHSFCRRCLARLVTSKYVRNDGSLQAPLMRISIVCPTCNTRSQEFGSLDDITTLHIINNLLEAQVKDRGETEKESHCCICKKSAKICCYRCNDCFCPDCYEMAKVQPCPVANADLAEFMQGVVIKHALVSIAVPLEDHCDCAEHSLPLNLFCSDCKQIICIDCFLLSHKHHQTKLVKYGREEALTHIEKIKLMRESNAERYRDLHQAAKYESAGASEDEQRIEDSEKRIHGLISSVFKKARSLHRSKHDIWRTAAEETTSFCDNSIPTCTDYDFNNKTDFELVCLLSDLQLAENRVQEEATNIESKLQSIGRIKSENNLNLHINEEPIFNCILSILNHVHFGQENIVKDLAYCYSFEDFSKGRYSESTEGQKDSNTPDSTLEAPRDNQYDAFTSQRQDEPMAFEEGLLDIPMLYNELEAVPERIRLNSSKLRRLYLETADLTSSVAAQIFNELRDDTRNVEVAYQKGVLPLVQQCVSNIKDYLNYCQFLSMEEWGNNITNITKEFKAQKEACDALAVIHAQFMCKLRQLKVVVSEHMEERRDIEDKYEEETGGLKKSSLFRLAVGAGAVVIGIFGPPVAAAAVGAAATTLSGIFAVGATTVGTVLVGYAVLFAIAARVIAGDTTEIDKKAYDKNAVVAVIMDTLLPALDEFISALEYAYGSLDVLRYELETLQVKVERANDQKGPKKLQYKPVNKNPEKIMNICNNFIAILPSIHNELNGIPKLGLDDGYVDKLQLMVKEIFSEHHTDMKMFEVVTKNNKKESLFSKVLFASTKVLLAFFSFVFHGMCAFLVLFFCYYFYRQYY